MAKFEGFVATVVLKGSTIGTSINFIWIFLKFGLAILWGPGTSDWCFIYSLFPPQTAWWQDPTFWGKNSFGIPRSQQLTGEFGGPLPWIGGYWVTRVLAVWNLNICQIPKEMVMKFQRQKQRIKNKDLLTLKNHGEGIRFFRFEMVPFHGTFVHFFLGGGGKGVKQNTWVILRAALTPKTRQSKSRFAKSLAKTRRHAKHVAVPSSSSEKNI